MQIQAFKKYPNHLSPFPIFIDTALPMAMIPIRGATEGKVTWGVGTFRFWIFGKLGFF